jgi:quinol monooxygenase YgiN
MHVYYCTFELPRDDREAFNDWMIEITRRCQSQDRCVIYEYVTNPARPDEGALMAAWADREAMDKHRIFEAHVEMAALGSSRYGMRNLNMHVWSDARGHAEEHFDMTDDSASGEMLRLVHERQALEARADVP